MVSRAAAPLGLRRLAPASTPATQRPARVGARVAGIGARIATPPGEPGSVATVSTDRTVLYRTRGIIALERLTDELRMDRDIVGLTRPLPACPAGEAVHRLRRGPSQLSVSRPLAGGPMGRQPGGLGIPSDSLGNSFTGRTSRPGSRRPLASREPGDEPSVLNATVERSSSPIALHRHRARLQSTPLRSDERRQ